MLALFWKLSHQIEQIDRRLTVVSHSLRFGLELSGDHFIAPIGAKLQTPNFKFQKSSKPQFQKRCHETAGSRSAGKTPDRLLKFDAWSLFRVSNLELLVVRFAARSFAFGAACASGYDAHDV